MLWLCNRPNKCTETCKLNSVAEPTGCVYSDEEDIPLDEKCWTGYDSISGSYWNGFKTYINKDSFEPYVYIHNIMMRMSFCENGGNEFDKELLKEILETLPDDVSKVLSDHFWGNK